MVACVASYNGEAESDEEEEEESDKTPEAAFSLPRCLLGTCIELLTSMRGGDSLGEVSSLSSPPTPIPPMNATGVLPAERTGLGASGEGFAPSGDAAPFSRRFFARPTPCAAGDR